NEIIRWSKGIWTSRWRLYPDAFFSMSTIVPTFGEQVQIANFLDRKTQQIDELIAAEQRKIERLKEYRQSLISEAVTGKIDVRNEV
ncbi:MAG: restriction endonuclease subunit S, partial [Candidatus Poribacteria bacterium]|nr:restriction endonuclease subunit S [Candidatus Poribacteria bacterium]